MEEIGRSGLLLEAINYVWQVWSCKSPTCSAKMTTPDDAKVQASAVHSAAEYGNTIGTLLTDAVAVGNPSSQPSEQLPLQSASRSISHDVVGARMLKQRTGLGNESQQRTFSLRDVEKHSNRDDCWIVIKGKVYDVSTFGKQHPGGSVIYTYAGRDATDVFSAFHASSTWKLLRQFYIGELINENPTPELLKDFREMRASLLREKMFESSKTYYVFKTLSVLLIGAMSLAVLLSYASSSLAGFWVSAFLMALFWQQSGWLAHDFLHHQVFETRWMNSAMGYFLGNVVQGFSNGWWKSKHNTHHAAPNECDTDFRAVDPDIDTLPLLAWSRDMLSQIEKDGWHRLLVRIQCYMFFPILLFARLSWCYQSVIWGQNSELPAQVRLVEGGLLLLHYAWLCGSAFVSLPPVGAISWILLSEFLCGLLLGIVFVQSHNGMEVYNDTKDFVSAQVVSTRDIQSSLFNDWFTGGLNRQIEHHLFPTLPRHNLGKIAGKVKALCEKHDLTYEDVGMLTGTRRVLDRLADVASVA